MSAESPNFQKLDASGLNFAILVARFNGAITEKLLAGAREAFTKCGAKSQQVFYVPGAFELPFAAKKLAGRGGFDAIVALGGGSPIDAAKAIAILTTNAEPLSQYQGYHKVLLAGAPLIGVAFDPHGGIALATSEVVYKLAVGVRGLLP